MFTQCMLKCRISVLFDILRNGLYRVEFTSAYFSASHTVSVAPFLAIANFSYKLVS